MPTSSGVVSENDVLRVKRGWWNKKFEKHWVELR